MVVIAKCLALNSTASVSMGLQDYCVKVNMLKLFISLYKHAIISLLFRMYNLVKILGYLFYYDNIIYVFTVIFIAPFP